MNDILVVDDHPLIARACHLVLNSAGFGNVISASDSDSGYAAFVQYKPDVVVVDLSLHKEELGGLALIRRIRSYDLNAKVLVFSMHADSESLVSAIEAGAMGYLIKDSPTNALKAAVQRVRLGHRYVDPQLALKLVFPNAALVSREKQVLALLLEGTSYEIIADQLGIKRKSVADLTRSAKRKLGSDHIATLIHLRGEGSDSKLE